MALRRVVHAQVVADRADDDLAGVEAHAHREAEAVRAPQLVGVALELVAQMQRRVAGALRVVLVRDRRAEQRHDAVAGVLVDRALEAVHAVGEDREEALQDPVPLLGVELLGQLHRALHVGEQHRDLLALAFERASATAGSCRRDAWGCRPRGPNRGRLFTQRSTAVAAELLLRFNRGSARDARAAEPMPALRAEAAVGTITMPAR